MNLKESMITETYFKNGNYGDCVLDKNVSRIYTITWWKNNKNKSYFFQNPNISSEDKNITQLKSPPKWYKSNTKFFGWLSFCNTLKQCLEIIMWVILKVPWQAEILNLTILWLIIKIYTGFNQSVWEKLFSNGQAITC